MYKYLWICYNSYLLSFTVAIQETNKQFLKQLHNAASEHNFYLCSFSFTSIHASKNQYIKYCIKNSNFLYF